MAQDLIAQEGKALAATSALVVGLMLGINYMVSENKDNNWLIWALLFLGLALVLWVWMYRATRAVERAADAERANQAEKAMKEAEEQLARLSAKAEANIADKPAPTVVESTPPASTTSPAPIEEVEEAPNEPEPTLPEPASELPEMPDNSGVEPEVDSNITPEPATPTASDEPDDLTRVEGIGPKYSETLIAAGVSTFAQVAEMTEEQLVAIIKDAGMRKPPSVGTWAEQAKLAAAGDWAGLEALQERLTGGRR